MNETTRADIAIIGTGPAGVSAAITARVRGKQVLLFGSKGLTTKMTKAHTIRNYPGLPDITGTDLADKLKHHLDVMGVEITEKQVTTVYAMGSYFGIQTPDIMYEASSVILAGGVVMGKPFPGEDELLGRGVSYCATCDGAFYGNGEVYVIGGGNSAVQEALYLENLGAKVHIVHRRGEFRAEGFIAEAAKENENIEIHWHTELKEIKGDKMVEGLVLYNNETGETTVVEKGDKPLGIFIYVGQQPQTDILAPIVKLKNGFVPVDRNCMTEVDGIFAAGDIVNKKFRQIVTACGDGCTAAMEVAERIVQYH